MSKKNISKNVLSKIQEHNITPKPKWKFLLKDYVLWSVFGVNMFFAAIFFSVTLLSLTNVDWDIYKYLHQNFIQYAVITVPYIRLIALILFVFLAYYNYRHTDKGYRYKARQIILMSLVIVVMMGGTMFVLGRAHIMEDILTKTLPHYETVEQQKLRMWYHPEEGLLTGTIIKIVNDDVFVIEDYYKKRWFVTNISNTIWRGPVQKPEVGLRIKIIGRQSEVDKFEAEEIRPWAGRMRKHDF